MSKTLTMPRNPSVYIALDNKSESAIHNRTEKITPKSVKQESPTLRSCQRNPWDGFNWKMTVNEQEGNSERRTYNNFMNSLRMDSMNLTFWSVRTSLNTGREQIAFSFITAKALRKERSGGAVMRNRFVFSISEASTAFTSIALTKPYRKKNISWIHKTRKFCDHQFRYWLTFGNFLWTGGSSGGCRDCRNCCPYCRFFFFVFLLAPFVLRSLTAGGSSACFWKTERFFCILRTIRLWRGGSEGVTCSEVGCRRDRASYPLRQLLLHIWPVVSAIAKHDTSVIVRMSYGSSWEADE